MKQHCILSLLVIVGAGAARAQTVAGPPAPAPAPASASAPATTQASPPGVANDEAEVKKAMAVPIAEIDLRKAPVLEGFERLRDVSGINIYVDVKTLRSL